MVSSLNSFGKREKERRRKEKQKDSIVFVLQNFPFFKERLNKNFE